MGHLRNKGAFVMCVWLCLTLMLVDETGGIHQEWLESGESSESDTSSDEVVTSAEVAQIENQSNTLRCHRRIYKSKVEQQDKEGRRCWDTVSLQACWGRCDSHETSEWKFPYKRSKHPVCSFGARREGVVELSHCEEGAAPEARIFRHVKPITCRCRACSSADTSCGWLPMTMN